MFDTLTTSALERMIRHLTAECHATHRKMIGPDLVPVISPMSDEWRVLSARHAELGETIEAAYAELIRREEEARTEVLPHDEGTSYCASIPGKCPVHDA